MHTRLFDDPDLGQFYDIENGWGMTTAITAN